MSERVYCDHCGQEVHPRRRNARGVYYCDGTCRQRAHRARQKAQSTAPAEVERSVRHVDLHGTDIIARLAAFRAGAAAAEEG
ncbi:MAG: hypothetical protein OXE87_11205 [Chloroflexi bacterium]|nr:hypothetical protein [Chloroflexota bacterium]